MAHTEDCIEYFPKEDLVIHNHIQPRKSVYKPSEQETEAYKLGHHRLTEIHPIKSDEPIEQWDCIKARSKRGDLWTGTTYLFGSQHNEQTAMAAVKRIRVQRSKLAKRDSMMSISSVMAKVACINRRAALSMT